LATLMPTRINAHIFLRGDVIFANLYFTKLWEANFPYFAKIR
jgi:hypothetical protein